MILNLKLYVTLSGSGSYALLVKLWNRASCYHATVPLPSEDSGKISEIRSSFSSIRSNFVGLNEDDWMSFDSMLEQFGNGEKKIHPSLKLAMSLACARASTKNQLWKIVGEPSRFPYIVGIAAKGSAWKEFLLIPHREKSVIDAYRMLVEAWKVLGEEMKSHGALRGRTSTGAWVSDLKDTEILYLVDQVAKDWNMGVGINVGADRLWDGRVYGYGRNSAVMKDELTQHDQMSLLSAVIEHYKIGYVEDPFHGSDFTSHAGLSHNFEDTVISGASIYKGDITRMKMAYRYRPTNAISVRPEDMHTVSRLSGIYDFARSKGMKLCLSVSESETGDDWISDLSIAFGANMLKVGVTGVANTSKCSRLLEIWEEVHNPTMGKMYNY